MRALALAFMLAACVEPVETPPDAPIDDTSVCCALVPDDAAARACFLAEPGTPPSGTCGAFVCPFEGEVHRINFCVP